MTRSTNGLERMPSRILGQQVWVDRRRREIRTDDGVVYTAAELELLKGTPAALLVAVHAWKRVFGGSVADGMEPAP